MEHDLWNELIQKFVAEPLGEREKNSVEAQRTIWDGSDKDWLLLPSVSIYGKLFTLVALGREGERRGLEVVRAFFGPKFTNSLRSVTQNLPSGTQIHMRSVILQDDEWDRDVAILESLVKVRIGLRVKEQSIAQPLSILLRDFYIAIAATAEFDAGIILDRIEGIGLLRGDNIEFLRLHLLASFGHWSVIYDSNKFDDLTRTRRSKIISEHLLRALWRKNFTSDSVLQGVDSLRKVFEDSQLAKRYRDLLGSVAQSPYPEVRTLLALFFRDINDFTRFEKLLEILPNDEVLRLNSIFGFSSNTRSQTTPKTEVSAADTEHPCIVLANSGDHLGVIGYYELHPGDERALGLAIESALELADNEVAARVVRCVDLGHCEIPDKRILLEALAQLRAKADSSCQGWLEWISRATAEPWGEVFTIVRDNSNAWETDWCDSAHLAMKFSEDLIVAFSGPNSLLVRQSTAFLLELVRENSTRAAISTVRRTALDVLVNLEMSNAQIRNAFVSLIGSYEEGNISKADYVELLDAASLIWREYGAVSLFAWFLDVLEQVLRLPCLDDGKLRQLINQSCVSLLAFGDNVDISLHNLLCEIADPYQTVVRRNLDMLKTEGNNWSKFNDLKIGIYSLLESLPDLRLKLADLCPRAEFLINQEKVASNELRAFAANSDIVVIHTSKAKHAATEELNRYITGQRIYVAGKGRGSIINALLNVELSKI